MLNDFLGESGLFPSEFMHIGGDEVDTRCWTEVEHVKKWLDAHNYTANDAYGYFILRVNELVKKYVKRLCGKKYLRIINQSFLKI